MQDKAPGVQGLIQLGRNAIDRVAELESEIARLRDALDQSALEYAELTVSAKSLEEHLHALVEVSEDSTIARARAVMNGDDIGEDADEDAARAGNGGGV